MESIIAEYLKPIGIFYVLIAILMYTYLHTFIIKIAERHAQNMIPEIKTQWTKIRKFVISNSLILCSILSAGLVVFVISAFLSFADLPSNSVSVITLCFILTFLYFGFLFMYFYFFVFIPYLKDIYVVLVELTKNKDT